MKISKKILAAGVVGTLTIAGVAVGVGAAYAQNTSNEDGLFSRVAQILGIDQSKLTNAMKQAADEKVDQNLKDGKITQDQANKMKEEIANGHFRPGGKGGPMMKGKEFEDLASYLGVTNQELRDYLKSDKKLSDLITSKGKTVDEVKNYLYQKTSENLQQLVKDGKLTQDEVNKMLERQKTFIDNLLNGTLPKRPMERPDFN